VKGSRRQLLLVPPTAKERFLGPSWSRVRWVPASRESSLLGGSDPGWRATSTRRTIVARNPDRGQEHWSLCQDERSKASHWARSVFICGSAAAIRKTVRCITSTMLASLWLAVTIVAACAGVASASADDSRLFPYGPTAHLWLLPKCGHGSRCEALANPHTAKVLAESIISERSQVEPQARQCQARQPSPIPRRSVHRRLPPHRDDADPPLDASSLPTSPIS
jgi:hypothetical protein